MVQVHGIIERCDSFHTHIASKDLYFMKLVKQNSGSKDKYSFMFSLPQQGWVPFPIRRFRPRIYANPYDGCW